MKIKLSKKVLSLFMAVVLAATSIPLAAFTASADMATGEVASGLPTGTDAYNNGGKYSSVDTRNEMLDQSKSTDIVNSYCDDYPEARFNFDTSLDGIVKASADLGGKATGYDSYVTNKAGTPQGDIVTTSYKGRDNCASITTTDAAASVTYDINPYLGKGATVTADGNGINISFWQNQLREKESGGYSPVVTFSKDAQHYLIFTAGGYMFYANGAADDKGYFVDYTINSAEDIVGIPYTSSTVTASSNDIWTHYSFTITPDDVYIYVDGIRYDYDTVNNAAGKSRYGNLVTAKYSDIATNWDAYKGTIAKEILNFVCDDGTDTYYQTDNLGNSTGSLGATQFALGLPYDIFKQSQPNAVDDIRLYDEPLTQVQIRSIYGENDGEEYYRYAEGHDPTIVENTKYTTDGNNGQFRYYMFGTAMTIYGSDDLANWTELADSQGRTGYQNEEYFGTSATEGTNYKNVLQGKTSEGYYLPLTYSYLDRKEITNTNRTGAGKMVWAPSVYFNEANQKWMLVSAASSWGSNYSCIFTAEADCIEGPYYNITPIMYSGLSYKSIVYEEDKTFKTNVEDIFNTHGITWNGRGDDVLDGSGRYYSGNNYTGYNESDWPNCIDACPFYGQDGNLYMVYGSFSGGIFMVRLKADGKSLYTDDLAKNDDGTTNPDQTLTYLTGAATDGYDIYFGKKVAASDGSIIKASGWFSSDQTVNNVTGSGEGTFCYVNNGYTYMNVCYGNVHNGKYTMRTWRNNSPCPLLGDFTDSMGTSSLTANNILSDPNVKSGNKLMGNYSFYGSDFRYYDNGHCSYLVTDKNCVNPQDKNKTFIAYHMRYDSQVLERAITSTNYLNEARVHQVVYNEDKLECVLPYQYAGETFVNDGKEKYNYCGTYAFIDHGETIASDFLTSETITLKPIVYDETGNIKVTENLTQEEINACTSGVVTGAYTGTWSVNNNYVTLKLNVDGVDKTYKGCFVMSMNEKGSETLTFSCVSTDSLETVWGARKTVFNVTVNFTNPDADLSMDPYIYVHGEDGLYNKYSYAYQGTEIADGSYTSDSAYVCEVKIRDGFTITSICNDDKADLGGYQLADGGAIKRTVTEEVPVKDAQGNVVKNEDGIEKTEPVKYNIYYLSGSVSTDPNTLTGQSGYDVPLRFNYTDSIGNDYSEVLYGYVMPIKSEAHSMSGVVCSGSRPRFIAGFIKAEGSLGHMTAFKSSNTYETVTINENGVANKYYAPQGVGIYKSLYDLTADNSNNSGGSSGDVVEYINGSGDASSAFILAAKNGSASRTDGIINISGAYDWAVYKYNVSSVSKNAVSNDIATIEGDYYLDASLPQDDLPSDTTIDSNANWSLSIKNSSVYMHPSNSSQEAKPMSSQYVSSVTCSNVNVTWSATSSANINTQFQNISDQNADNYVNAFINYSYTLPSRVHTSTVSGQGKQTGIQLRTTLKQEGEKDPKSIDCTIGLNLNVYTCDKSIARTAYENVDKQLTSNSGYTAETWKNYKEVLKVTNAYLNNPTNVTDQGTITVVTGTKTATEDYTKTYVIDPNATIDGATQTGTITRTVTNSDGSTTTDILFTMPLHSTLPTDEQTIANSDKKSQLMFKLWLDAEYNKLFPQDLYDNVKELITTCNDIYNNRITADLYTTDSYQKFVETYHNVYDDYIKYSDDPLADDSWRTINGDKAKENYTNAKVILETALAQLRVKADYTAYDAAAAVAYKNGVVSDDKRYYLESTVPVTNDQGEAVVDENGKEVTEQVQDYTVSTYDAYNSALDNFKSITNATQDKTTRNNQTKYTSETKYMTLYSWDPNTNTYVASSDQFATVDTTTQTDLQNGIDTYSEPLKAAAENLTACDSDEAYEAYDEAQRLSFVVDHDAYKNGDDIYQNHSYGYNLTSKQGAIDFKTEFDDTKAYGWDQDDDTVTEKLKGVVYVKYTDPARGDTEAKIYKNTALGKTDPYTTTVLNTLNNENGGFKTYDVTYNIYRDDFTTVAETGTAATNLTYGSNVKFDFSSYLNENTYDVAKVEIETIARNGNGSTAISIVKAPDNNVIERSIQQNTTINVYLRTAVKAADENQTITKVTVYDYFGTPLDIGYVDLSDEYYGGTFKMSVDKTTDSATYGAVTFKTLPKVAQDNGDGTSSDVLQDRTVAYVPAAYYDFTGWYWQYANDAHTEIALYQTGTHTTTGSDGAAAEALPTGDYKIQSATINAGVLEISDYTGSDYTVSTNTVTGATTLTGIPLDTVMTFSIAESAMTDFYAWVKTKGDGTKWYIASYNREFKNQAGAASGYYYMPVTKEQLAMLVADTDKYDADVFGEVVATENSKPLPFSFCDSTVKVIDVGGAKKFRLYCDYTLNDSYTASGIEIVQCGAVATNDSSVGTDKNNFQKGLNGVITIAANSTNSYNAYSISIGYNGKYDNMYMRSYVSYMYTTTVKNSDGTEKTVTVPRVDYGPVYCCAKDGTISKVCD